MIIKILEDRPHIMPEYLSYIGNEHKLVQFDQYIDPTLVEAIMMRSQIHATADFLKTYPNIKCIYRVGVGLDNVDTKYCDNNRIKIINTPGANADAVADLVIWGMLSLGRRTNIGDHNWQNRYHYEGEQLDSQKIGIVGFGNIGKKIHKRLLGFGVSEFCVYDPFLSQELVNEYRGCIYIKDLSELVNMSDIMTLHLPLTDDTHHIISHKLLSQAKSNLKIINTSRGGIIDEKGLYEFLKKNKSAGAMMDVWESEPKIEGIIKELINLNNFILTPHIGAMTIQATQAMHYFQNLE